MTIIKGVFCFLALYLGLFALTFILVHLAGLCMIILDKIKLSKEKKEEELKQRDYTPKPKKTKPMKYNSSLGVWEEE